MASTMAMPAIRTAVLAILRNTIALTVYVGARIYPDDNGDAPQKPTYPYVQIEGDSETPWNTFGGPDLLSFGSEARVKIRVCSQTRSDAQADTMSSVIKGALDGQTLTVAGYASADIEYETCPKEIDFGGGIVTREWVNTYLISVHQ